MLHEHMLPVICGTSLAGVAGTLALAGLVGSAAHCVGMCGPFVLAQLTPNDPQAPEASADTPKILHLVRGATIPYHLGRLTTYTVLGAAAGAAGHALARAIALAPIFSALLLIAAAIFLFQALESIGLTHTRFPARLVGKIGVFLANLFAPLFQDRLLRGYWLGMALGFLPCGFLYGALFAAAGTGNAGSGALAMAAFAVGTVPSLVLVGCGASLVAAKSRQLARVVLAPLQAVTAITLAFFAVTGIGWPL